MGGVRIWMGETTGRPDRPLGSDNQLFRHWAEHRRGWYL